MAGYRFGNSAQFGTGNTISGTLCVAMGTGNTLAAGVESSLVGGSGNSLESGAKYSMVFGKANTLSGAYTPTGTWIGGSGNNVAADYSLVIGRNCVMESGCSHAAMFGRSNTGTNSADYTIIGGFDNNVSGSYGLVVGESNFVQDGIDYTGVFGYANTAILGATLIGGFNNTAGVASTSRGECALVTGDGGVGRFYGGHTISGDMFTIQGDAQTTRAMLKIQTTDATATTMLAGAYTTHLPILANDSAVIFKAHIIARETGTDDNCAAYELLGALDRNATAGTTALLGSVTKVVIHEDTAGWDVNATADATNGSLDIKVTGAASENVNWVCVLDFTEVVG